MGTKTEETVSVLDHEAFAAKHMPDLGYNVKELQVFHWKLQDWKKLEKKLTSPEFDCGGHKWRILLFPFGNSNVPPSDVVSVYLDSANTKEMEEGWHVCAQFALVISNPQDPTIYTVNHANHRFTAEEPDWGFIRFIDLRRLFQPQPGRNRPTIERDSAIISAYVRVLEDPTGVMWHTFVNYDSKKQTGYVGLKNQGTTGYMSSVLQSLFHTRYFRRAVYQIPTEDEDPIESIPLALQRVFYRLQTSDKPVGTNELAKSFGWTSLDSFLQHDVQEFNRALQDKLESKMKSTRAEGVITKLFVGETKSLIECVNVFYESTRIEWFNDVQLSVKGIKTLYDSFQDYVAVETLDGGNKYQTEGFGLQDARKRIIFQSLPPVLHLQLKRYGYDMQHKAMVKINDRFEFPFEIDLDEFLDETADRSKPWKYKLHGVLVHSGELDDGHYFTFIKPDRDTRWLKFDDDRVTPMTDREVLEESYGGEPSDAVVSQTQENQVRAAKGFTNAYMLVYIRETAIDEVLGPLTEDDTPPHLGQRLSEERIQKMEARKREREEHHVTAKVITDETFSLHQGFDLAIFGERNGPPSDLQTFRVLKQETYSVFKSRVAQRFGYPESQIRLWVLVNRRNKTVRPNASIPENEPSLTIEMVRNNMAPRLSDLRLYLEILSDPLKEIQFGSPEKIMIFLKHFDTTRQSLFGIGKVHIPRAGKVNGLIPIINERMMWTPGTPLKLYEEIKPGMIELMNPEHTFYQSEAQDGDIICFQLETSDMEVHDLESQGLYSNPPQFYKFLRNRAMEPDKRMGSPDKPGSSREDQNAVSEPADLYQPDPREEPSLGTGSLRTVSDIGAQQQQHGRIPPPTASLSQVLRDSEPEIERYVNEMDDCLGNHVLSDWERQKLFNELCKTCSRHRVIPKSMHIPDCSKGSVEVECGGSAIVSQSTYKGYRVAVKVIHGVYANNLDVIRSRFCREAVAWRHLRHPNILPLLGVTTSEHRLAMVSEWMENGNINQFIEKDRHVNRTMLLVDVANGLRYMHGLRIVHGDLKGANILINKDRRACIADFGLTTITGIVTHAATGSSQASQITNESLMSFTAGGTYRWMSPELLVPGRFGVQQPEDNRPTTQSDCYALGMVIYEVLCGHHPYVEIQSGNLVVYAIMEGVRPQKPEGATRLGFTEKLWRILESCWLEDRSARPSVEEILPCLNDAAAHWYMGTPLTVPAIFPLSRAATSDAGFPEIDFISLGNENLIRLGEDFVRALPFINRDPPRSQMEEGWINSISEVVLRAGTSPTSLSPRDVIVLAETFCQVFFVPC
ncbi:hypothetical protein BDM02DRAFT_3167185 [Thelephora ganbajun]|uniref:Uncharacterized protein n=1 Tax=Thelephora ganbajun TaxID=370292 RepID=A0ACB6ZID6_THEGA|nr:hypothetical protein BDM02DRAFT_3167185 [Thelephora ganbajun]